MTKTIAIMFVLGLGLPLGASVRVPSDIRNPFEVPDPIDFRDNASDKLAKNAVDPAIAAREKKFADIRDKLIALPVKGIAADYRKPDNATVLVGPYTLKSGMDIPASDFDFKGLIRVASVTPTEIVVNVSIELETRKITIPLAR
ncbi:MAG: hypothetical protein JW942_01450 [Opitutales bacterium]|nr:hypothetical protein [Opitutales bacterium]